MRRGFSRSNLILWQTAAEGTEKPNHGFHVSGHLHLGRTWQNQHSNKHFAHLCSCMPRWARTNLDRSPNRQILNRQAMAKPSPFSQASDMKPSSFSPMAANVFCTSCRGFQSSAIQVSALVSNAAHGRKAASTDCPWVVSVHWNILKSFLVGQVCFLFFVAGSFQTPELLGTCDWSECQVLTSIENDSEAVEHQSAPIAHQRPVTRRVNLNSNVYPHDSWIAGLEGAT